MALVPFVLPADARRARHFTARRYGDWLPVPERCPACDCAVALVRNRVLYWKDQGDWPFVYWCLGCGASASTHPNSVFPRATLADAATRRARTGVHSLLDPLWRGGSMTRAQAYDLLAMLTGRVPGDRVHVGEMDAAECAAATDALVRHWADVGGDSFVRRALSTPDAPEDDFADGIN